MPARAKPGTSRPAAGTRRAGYVITAAVNAVLLVVVNNLLAWGWLPFLTGDFTRVLPILNLSLTATIAANLVFLAYDPPRLVAAGRLLLDVISLAVLMRIWNVFPFDFSRYGALPWAGLTRVVLVVALVGTSIAVIVDAIRLTRTTPGRESGRADPARSTPAQRSSR